jgi:hypothetical protein
MIWFFLHVPYLVVLFQIVNDVFADSNRTGWSKTLWVLVLIFLPILDGLAYLIAHGQSIPLRQAARADANRNRPRNAGLGDLLSGAALATVSLRSASGTNVRDVQWL